MKRIKGFTLIELLVVIAIIAILASIILTSLNTSEAKSRDARRVSDIKELQLALSLYYNDNNAYPATLAPLSPNYISVIPKDPKDGSTYNYAALGSASCTSYHLGANLEINTSASPASPLYSDADAVPSGQSAIGGGPVDGAVCSGSGVDFSGADPVYDVLPN